MRHTVNLKSFNGKINCTQNRRLGKKKKKKHTLTVSGEARSYTGIRWSDSHKSYLKFSLSLPSMREHFLLCVVVSTAVTLNSWIILLIHMDRTNVAVLLLCIGKMFPRVLKAWLLERLFCCTSSWWMNEDLRCFVLQMKSWNKKRICAEPDVKCSCSDHFSRFLHLHSFVCVVGISVTACWELIM